jgi:hypothetical protein
MWRTSSEDINKSIFKNRRKTVPDTRGDSLFLAYIGRLLRRREFESRQSDGSRKNRQ